MIQEQAHITKGVLQAYSEKNGGVLIDTKWYTLSGVPVTSLAPLRRKAVTAEVSADGRFVTNVQLDATVPAQATFRKSNFGGRSEEESRRIVRQATLNTATAIYDLALRTTAGSFSSPSAASPADVAEAIKAEVMRIAGDLENHVYR